MINCFSFWGFVSRFCGLVFCEESIGRVFFIINTFCNLLFTVCNDV